MTCVRCNRPLGIIAPGRARPWTRNDKGQPECAPGTPTRSACNRVGPPRHKTERKKAA